MVPRACGSQYGDPSPARAGTKTTPPASGTLAAKGPDLGGSLDDAQAVAKPLHGGSGDEDGALERVVGALDLASCHGGEQAVARNRGAMARVHQEEAARAVRVLGESGSVACLPEKRGLLVPGHARDRNAFGQAGAAGLAEDLAGEGHPGQDRARNVEDRQELIVPIEIVDVEEEGARGVGRIGDVRGAVREAPREPGIDGAEGELAALGARARAGNRIEKPRELRPGKIGIDLQPGPLAEPCFVAGLPERVTSGRGASVLPDDRVGHGLAGLPVPKERGLALVGDPHRGDFGGRQPGRSERPGGDVALGGEDLLGIVLDPARLWEDLAEFLLGSGDRRPGAVEDDRAGTCRALVQGKDGFHLRWPAGGPMIR